MKINICVKPGYRKEKPIKLSSKIWRVEVFVLYSSRNEQLKLQ